MENDNENSNLKECTVTESNSIDNNNFSGEDIAKNIETSQISIDQNIDVSSSIDNKNIDKNENVESNEIDFIKESLKEIENDINEIVNVTIGDEISKEKDNNINDVSINNLIKEKDDNINDESINNLIKEQEINNESDNIQSNESIGNPIQEAILKDIKLTKDTIKNIEKENDISSTDSKANETKLKSNLENEPNESNSISNDTSNNVKLNIDEGSTNETENNILNDSESISNDIETISKDSINDVKEKESIENENKDNIENNEEKGSSNEMNNDIKTETDIKTEINVETEKEKTNKEEEEEDNESSSSSDDTDSSSDSSDFDTDSSDDDSSSSDDDVLTKEKVEKHKKIIDKYNEDLDEDNDENTINLIHSTHEIISLPKVQPITIDIPKDLPITKIGVIQNIVDEYVLVQATVSANYQVLDEDSILLFSDRTPVGRIFETLGPVSLPIYSIRFNSASEIDKEKYKIGTNIYFNPELAKLSYTQQIKLIKGSDASNQYDEEPGEDEIEFSDDEKEIEYKKHLKNKKKEKGNEKKRQKLNDGRAQPSLPDLNSMEYEPLQRGMPPPNKNYYNQPQGYKNYPIRKPMPYKPYPNKDGYNGGGRGRGGRRFYGKYNNQGQGQGQIPGSSLPNYGQPHYNNMNPPPPPPSSSSSDMNYPNEPNFDYYGNPFDFNSYSRPNLAMRVPPSNPNPMIIDYGSSENDNLTTNEKKE
ncbi:NAF1-domain-containing protein [Neocallimastix sp. 'constans']|jgi:rRNA processing protein Gar1